MHRTRTLEGGLIAWTPLLVGLVVWPTATPGDTFAAPKILTFALITALIGLLRLLGNYQNLTLRSALLHFRNPVHAIPAIVLTLLAVTTALSINPLVSMYGDQNSQVGTLFYALVILYLWLTLTYAGKISLCPAMAFCLIIPTISLVEFIGLKPFGWLTEMYYTIKSAYPIVATGYRGHLAGLLTVTAGFVMAQILDRRRAVHPTLYILLFLGFLAVVCLSNTSSTLAAAAGLLIIWLIKRDFKTTLISAALFIAAFPTSTALSSLNKLLVNYHIVATASHSEELNNTTTLQTRLLLWKAALILFQERPVFGWGANTYENLWYSALEPQESDRLLRLELGISPNVPISRINDSIAYRNSAGKVIPNNLIYGSSHNAYLDVLYSTGLFGVAALALMLMYVRARQAWTPAALTMMAVFGIYLLAWFPVSTNFLPFIALLVLIIIDERNRKGQLNDCVL